MLKHMAKKKKVPTFWGLPYMKLTAKAPATFQWQEDLFPGMANSMLVSGSAIFLSVHGRVGHHQKGCHVEDEDHTI